MPSNACRTILPLLLYFWFCPVLHAEPTAVPVFPGQAFTLLSDGHVLVTGGFDQAGHAVSDAYLVDTINSAKKLNSGLLHARGWHSATALPNGRVLIFGGKDGNGRYLRSMEIYDPITEQFTQWSGLPLVPRASHTATLLTDGRVVVIGGTGEGGAFPDDIQLWDFRTGQIESLHIAPTYPRQRHSAKLLANGTIEIEGAEIFMDLQ